MNFRSFFIFVMSLFVLFIQTTSVSAASKDILWIVTDSSGVEWCEFPFSMGSTDETIQAIKKVKEFVICKDYGLSSTDTAVLAKYNIGFPDGNATLNGREICMEKGKESPCVPAVDLRTTTPSISGSTGTITPQRKRNIKRSGSTSQVVQVNSGALAQSGTLMQEDTTSDITPMKASPKNVSVNDSFGGLFSILAAFAAVLSFLPIVIHFLTAWGLYLINKKSGEPHPWLAFIPVVQVYSFVKAGGKDGIWVLWLILGYIVFFLPGLILTIIVIHSTSKRTGNGAGTTILAIFFPYIMYPIMGNNMIDEIVQPESIVI